MPKKQTDTLAARLKLKRQAKELSRVQVAERMGVSKPYYADLEHGRRPNPSLETLRKVAAALGCTVGELVD
jgi:putative transcriptional regulator